MTHSRTTDCRSAAVYRTVIILALLVPTAALAHPGHDGGFLPGLLHPFHGLDHLLAAIAVGAWGARIGGRATWAFPAAFVGAMLVGGAIGQAGVAFPGTEIMIALSVLLFGVVLVMNARIAASAGAAIVALFALFHGGAHGAEAPTQSGFLLYALGLGGATMVLHLCGLGAALALKARPWIMRMAAAPVALAGMTLLVSRLG